MIQRLASIVFACALAAGAAIALIVQRHNVEQQVNGPAIAFTSQQRDRLLRLSPLPPVPRDPTNRVGDDPSARHLGRYLFFDTRFSRNNAVSCATCHDPNTGFNDASPRGRGVGVPARHTPSLWNVAYNRWFGWGGAADTLWSFALHAIESPDEHGSSRLEVAHAIYADHELRNAYEHVFGAMPDLSDRARFPGAGRPIENEPNHPRHRAWQSMREDDRHVVNQVFANFGKALAAYQRQLISRDAPFDRFVRGLRHNNANDQRALSLSAQRGAALFAGRGQCTLCHNGPNLTDGEFHNIGVPPAHGGPPRDPGRYRGAKRVKDDPFNAAGRYSEQRMGREADYVNLLKIGSEAWGQFKTPSLRNIAQTDPYMHQGQFETLRDVLDFYSTLEPSVPIGHHQEQILQPLHLSEQETNDLLAFLRSLTGTPIPRSLKQPPDSPMRHPNKR